MTTVRTILAIATSKGWSLQQMDVSNAFLRDDLKEEIYRSLAAELFSLSSSVVCKLKCSFYELKHAPRAWFDKFHSTLLGFSFTKSQCDSSLFISDSKIDIVLLLVYMDDIVIIETDSGLISYLQDRLKESFLMKDLEPLQYFLGLEVISDPMGLMYTNLRIQRSDFIGWPSGWSICWYFFGGECEVQQWLG